MKQEQKRDLRDLKTHHLFFNLGNNPARKYDGIGMGQTEGKEQAA